MLNSSTALGRVPTVICTTIFIVASLSLISWFSIERSYIHRILLSQSPGILLITFIFKYHIKHVYCILFNHFVYMFDVLVIDNTKINGLYYRKEDVVTCLDTLSITSKPSDSTLRNRQFLHFAFVGDSRMRQIFFNFIAVIIKILT